MHGLKLERLWHEISCLSRRATNICRSAFCDIVIASRAGLRKTKGIINQFSTQQPEQKRQRETYWRTNQAATAKIPTTAQVEISS